MQSKRDITCGNKFKGASLEMKELHELNIQRKGYIFRESRGPHNCKVCPICEFGPQGIQVWAQIAGVQTLAYTKIKCISSFRYIIHSIMHSFQHWIPCPWHPVRPLDGCLSFWGLKTKTGNLHPVIIT
jgi:hypothetical protein